MYVYVSVCVRESEREQERKRAEVSSIEISGEKNLTRVDTGPQN